MKTSLKHLFRTPVKTLLFLLLMTACTVLLVLGASLLVQANAQIEAAKREFVTLGTVEQKPDHIDKKVLYNSCLAECGDYWGYYSTSLDVTTYRELVTPEMLDFEGADYVHKPVTRPNYVAYLPDSVRSFNHSAWLAQISEFTVKEILDEKSMLVEIEKFLYLAKDLSVTPDLIFGDEVGDEIKICLHNQPAPQEFQVGKRYIGTLAFDFYYTPGMPGDFHGWEEDDPRIREKRVALVPGPFSTQADADTRMPIEGETIPWANNLRVQDGAWEYLQPRGDSETPKFSDIVYADEVTDGFYEEGGRGEIWLNWAEGFKREFQDQQNFPVVPVDNLQLFPSFHGKEAVITGGRAITQEEFASGEKVCLLTRAFAAQNHLKVGDKLPLSLVYSMYGTFPILDGYGHFSGMCSPLNAQGQLYEPFWECEYEVVGLYDIPFDKEFKWVWTSEHEILGDTIIIPAKSVEVSDENNIAYYSPMNTDHTSFIIPNGTIEEFDKKLHEAVPEAEMLNITYDDNGYTDVVASLNNAKLSSMILFLVALFASLAIIILLLYFFVVKEKKRTAVERSLGMTRRQCRTSLVAGILVLTVLGACLGSVGGAAAVEYLQHAPAQETTDTAGYDTSYSMWAQSEESQEDLLPEAPTPVGVYLAVPLAQIVAVLVLALLFAQQNLKAKPIVLLSTKEE